VVVVVVVAVVAVLSDWMENFDFFFEIVCSLFITPSGLGSNALLVQWYTAIELRQKRVQINYNLCEDS
jgi:hypothetical protein